MDRTGFNPVLRKCRPPLPRQGLARMQQGRQGHIQRLAGTDLLVVVLQPAAERFDLDDGAPALGFDWVWGG